MTTSQPHCGTLYTGYRSGNVWSLSCRCWCLIVCTAWPVTMCQTVADNAGRRHLCSAERGSLAVPATMTLWYGPRSIHLEFCSSIATQLPSYIHVLSWSENWTVYQSISPARLWLFLAVRAGEHNFSAHLHHRLIICLARYMLSPVCPSVRHTGGSVKNGRS